MWELWPRRRNVCGKRVRWAKPHDCSQEIMESQVAWFERNDGENKFSTPSPSYTIEGVVRRWDPAGTIGNTHGMQRDTEGSRGMSHGFSWGAPLLWDTIVYRGLRWRFPVETQEYTQCTNHCPAHTLFGVWVGVKEVTVVNDTDNNLLVADQTAGGTCQGRKALAIVRTQR